MKTKDFRGSPKRTAKRGTSYILRRILIGISFKRQLCGCHVAMFMPTKEDKKNVFPKIETALELIARFAPHRIGQIRRLVKRIWIFPTAPYDAVWQGDLDACVLDRNYVRSAMATPEEIATSIVHEATHARVELAGIRYQEKTRLRIERLCMKTEVWLAKRFPNQEALLESKRLNLEHYTANEDYWTNDAFQDRNLAALKEMGQKSWAIRRLANMTEKIITRRKLKRASSSIVTADNQDRAQSDSRH